MAKQQFTIRSLLIATLLVALSLPVAIRHYDKVMIYFFPPPKPAATTQLSEAQIIQSLLRRVPPSSSKEIIIRPLGDSMFDVTISN